MTSPAKQSPPSRKAQALAFIEQFLIEHNGHSPTMDEIAGALGVSDTRAKALVHKLAQEKAIHRLPGAQRGISVPGLARRMEIEQAKALLRAEGMKVDEDFVRHETFPKGHLPIVAVIAHTPSPVGEGGGDGGGWAGT